MAYGKQLFSVFIESPESVKNQSRIFDRVLKTSILCPRCENCHNRSIVNRRRTAFACPNCLHRFCDQYTYATTKTVRADRSVIAVHPLEIKLEPKFGKISDGRVEGYWIKLDLLTANSAGNDILVQFEVQSLAGDARHTKNAIVAPRYRSELTEEISQFICLDEAPSDDIFAIEVRPIHKGEAIYPETRKLVSKRCDRWVLT